ncbi:MAG TPA: cys-tRNA(pro)/cys-tRNA(cys) deacylase [Propionibacteriaceae bacterium]|nr:YbaK/EbsC family protein [Micropruina sp.]HBX81269.1 cys-tRNA(pro)/cys-tRNA(cys) deacylase [Propionibacteriaceae bacterium]HBY22777.1 cys-tRNA(pro)/cys-tRNA(cys) deacylase [Propionibacteriaceae bacterium]
MTSPSAPTEYPEGTQRVAAALAVAGLGHQPVLLPVTGRTAQDAADALGVELGQIAKSIVFRRVSDDAAVMVVTAGDQRVDQAKVSALVGELGRADAAFVKEATGFSIGGVSPVAHTGATILLVDETLFRFENIWAAAGHPHAVFELTPADLVQLTGAPVTDVVERAQA